MPDFQTKDTNPVPPEQPLPEEMAVSVPAAAENSGSSANARQVKIFCFKCQQKLDVTGLMPFAHINCPVCGTDLIIPKWFDNYLLEEPCGRGGMASVYRALDIALDREVAVKILNHIGLKYTGPFLNEARIAATINHSSVIPIYTCGIFDQQAYMVMQFMNGGSLEQKLLLKKGSPLAIDDVLQWIHDVAEGLDYAAKHGIIHHDVKPGNIMLDNDGNAKIGDFGIADRKQDQEQDEMDKNSYGSPLYVSPEKVSTGNEDCSGDIYRLGATFYHLLTGVPPFQHENLEELLWARVRQNPVAPHQLRPGISPLISSLIMRMMNHSPEMRPGYEEIIRNLNVFLRSNDTAPVVMHKEIPLPKGGGNSTNSTSSLRVKSPSAMLKRRRSSIVRANPEATSEQDVKPLGKMVADAPVKNHVRPVSGKNSWLLISLILTAVCAAGFAAFSTVQLIQAFNFPSIPVSPSNQTVRLK